MFDELLIFIVDTKIIHILLVCKYSHNYFKEIAKNKQ